jgi:SAM-dependent methyltransferase
MNHQPRTCRIDRVFRPCPLCADGSRRRTLGRYSTAEWQVARCEDCGFVYVPEAPPLEVLEVDLAWEKSYHAERERRTSRRSALAVLDRATRWRMRIRRGASPAARIAASVPPGAVLDVGCGTGRYGEELPAGYTPFGIEISRELARHSDEAFRRRGGHAVHASALEGLGSFADGFFTATVLRSFLEHEVQPLPVLREIARVLAPGGIAVVKVPNFGSLNRLMMGRRWCGIRLPDHLNYFTPATLRRMAEEAGLEVRFDRLSLLPTADNMWAVLTKPSRAPRSAPGARKRGEPAMAAREPA